MGVKNKMTKQTLEKRTATSPLEIDANLKRLKSEVGLKYNKEPYKVCPSIYRYDSLNVQKDYLRNALDHCVDDPTYRFAAFRLARIIEKETGYDELSYNSLKKLWVVTGQKNKIAKDLLGSCFCYGQKEFGYECIYREDIREKTKLVREARQIYSEMGENIKVKATDMLISELSRHYSSLNGFGSLPVHFKAQNAKQKWLDRVLGGHF